MFDSLLVHIAALIGKYVRYHIANLQIATGVLSVGQVGGPPSSQSQRQQSVGLVGVFNDNQLRGVHARARSSTAYVLLHPSFTVGPFKVPPYHGDVIKGSSQTFVGVGTVLFNVF